MRHRMINFSTGLGNSGSVKLNNKPDSEKRIYNLLKKYEKEILNMFTAFGYCDFSINKLWVDLGVEPAYMYENLKIIRIHKKKELSFLETGYAWGGYGSDIASTKKYYSDYKYNGKVKKFIDKFHQLIWQKK